MMTPEELLNYAAKIAREIFANQGKVLPMFLIMREDGKIAPMIFAMPQKHQMRALGAALRAYFKTEGVVQYASLLEAWTVETVEIPDSIKLGGGVASHPDRREIIKIVVETKTTELTGTYYILRPEHGPAKLSPFQIDTGYVPVAGNLIKLLKPEEQQQ